MNWRRWIYPGVAILAGAVMLLRVASTFTVFNATYDEPYHITSAVALAESHRSVHGIEQPPLARIVQGIALKAIGVSLPDPIADRKIFNMRETFRTGDIILSHSAAPYWRILTTARSANLVFAIVALMYVYLLGKWIGGPIVAMLATVFFSTDPTFLAHAGLATTDSAATAGLLAASYHALRWWRTPRMSRAIIAGLAIGGALACKFTCVALIPAFIPLMIWRWWRRRGISSPGPKLLPQLALLAFTALATLWATYAFDVGKLSETKMFDDGELPEVPRWLLNIPLPMPGFPLGLLAVKAHSQMVQAAYLNGNVIFGGRWYYFPEAILVKSPTAFAIGLVLALLTALAYQRWRRLDVAIALIAFTLLIIAMQTPIQIGVRHVLPVLPLFYILIVHQLARRGWIIALALLIVANFFETGLKHPDYISFFNAPARMISSDSPLLLDSNLDWGQDVARLNRWLRDTHPNATYKTRLFARPSAAQCEPGFDLEFNQPHPGHADLLIISKNLRYRLYPLVMYDPALNESAANIQPVAPNLKLIAHIGDSIDVYELH